MIGLATNRFLDILRGGEKGVKTLEKMLRELGDPIGRIDYRVEATYVEVEGLSSLTSSFTAIWYLTVLAVLKRAKTIRYPAMAFYN